MDFHRRYPTAKSVEEQRLRIPLQLKLGDGSFYEKTGRISFADRQIDPTTGAIRIAALFENPNGILRPGGFGRIRATFRLQNGALLVPQRAVTELQGSQQVAVVGNDSKVNIRPVKVGDRVGTMWVVTDGLKPGESVVVEGLMKIRDGVTVKVVPAAPAKAGA